jgi:hypothetical protein
VALGLRDIFQFIQNLLQVVRLGVRHLVFEIEVDSLSSGYRNSVLSLVFLDELPEGVGAELFLEADGHHLVLSDLGPLNSV